MTDQVIITQTEKVVQQGESGIVIVTGTIGPRGPQGSPYESAAAQLATEQAREDMVLLRKILAVEKANRRLALPAVEPILDVSGTITNEIELELDRMERMEANTVINTASSETIEWVTRRAMSKDSLTDIVVN